MSVLTKRGNSATKETMSSSQVAFSSSGTATTTPTHSSGTTSFTRNGANKSPVSPSRITRLREKEDMQNLNERLIIYIDTVRRLETENNQLRAQVTTFQSTSSREIVEIKGLYEAELEGAKKLIDDLAKDSARKDIDLNKFKLECEEAQKKLAKRDNEARSLEGKFKAAESEVIEYRSR